MMSIPGKPLTVYEVTSHIKRLMEGDDLLSQVTVEGEISNLVKAASGHAYFTLKDAKATLKAAIWAGTRRRITCELSNGAKVIATGGISVYEPRGEYQIIVSDLKPAGLGALYEAFEKRKAQLAAEGLFDPDRKKPLPFLPRGIGMVTSPKGAVVQDMFRVIRRRFPNMPLFLVPSKVQGDGAEEEIIRGIARLERDPRVDVIIIARGGGSLEDLWAFNGEALARAIAAATKPIVSAVGHETDTTIADFVADRRAATPSVAGELVVPVKEDLLKEIATWRLRMQRALKGRIDLSRRRLEKALACRFLRKPEAWISEKKLVVANLSRDLEFRFREFFKKARHRCDMLLSRLQSLNPRAVLQRGFLMATDEHGQVLTSITQTAPGQSVSLAFADGAADAVIKTITPAS